jgi:hypothetical protein
MRRIDVISGLWASAVALAGCTTGTALTAEGLRVEHVTQADLPGGCNFIADVPIGIAPDGSRPRTEDELSILLRNKAGEQGGDHVVTDFSEQRGTADEPRFVGRGRSYRCPPPPPEPREPETAGGEEEAEEGAGEGEDEGEAAGGEEEAPPI